MLVLTRRVNEEIIIDGNIRITITAIAKDKVRIGVSAPDNVRVDRAEVHARRSEFAEEATPVIELPAVTAPAPVAAPVVSVPRTRLNAARLHRVNRHRSTISQK